ncbi:TPA: type II toxin-antitoxin system RelB/DinJ family antitoxin [Pseudomonas aeruginosa]|uniref:type II toxin-antitoxin system RelB/DinJ family antitoxin n=1 Tax=Pseudomonas aeruginosa TaxID=287 RepID=UPI002359A0D5|nr:type II toxin-antitoxin system RelB/DinJ family antitoxin [Pseudomonas aeruginosa]MEE4320274.1 type II toxin-antitoxin system RelB/DinJ family antitoxin [Pseudomonas aeruginosa]
MAATEIVRARIEPELKEAASKILEAMDITISQAIRMMLMQVVERETIPFPVKKPSKATVEVLNEIRDGKGLTRYASIEEAFEDLGI